MGILDRLFRGAGRRGEGDVSPELDALFTKVYRFMSDEAFQNQELGYSSELLQLMTAGGGVDEIPGAIGEFGREYGNPIPVNGPVGELVYISNLTLENGCHVMGHRLGSAERIDVYETVTLDGSRWDILFFDMYHTRKSRRDIGWAEIIAVVFRVRDFDRAGTTIGPRNEVRARSATEPYGYLLVESPMLKDPVTLPVTHRDDFLLASSVFDEPTLADAVTDAELLVTYVPEHSLPGGMAGIKHALHYVIVPPGTLDRYYEARGCIHMSEPAPQKLFGRFAYAGELRVKVNEDPQF